MPTLANTGIMYVGTSGVNSTFGVALYPGDVYSIDIENLNLIYVVSTVDTEDIQFTYFT